MQPDMILLMAARVGGFCSYTRDFSGQASLRRPAYPLRKLP